MHIGNEVFEPAEDDAVVSVREQHISMEWNQARPATGGFNLIILSNAKGKGVCNDENGGRKIKNTRCRRRPYFSDNSRALACKESI